MVAVTSVMRAHQILLARVETALRPYDLSFSRYELLRLLAFSRSGALPITKASDRLQVHVTSVTHAIRRLEADGLVRADPASDRRPHHPGADHRPRPLDGRGRDRHAQQRGVRRHRHVRRRVTGARRFDRDAAPPRRRLLTFLREQSQIAPKRRGVGAIYVPLPTVWANSRGGTLIGVVEALWQPRIRDVAVEVFTGEPLGDNLAGRDQSGHIHAGAQTHGLE